ncbi:MAG: lysophospholipid acyltransferase family protein [Chitinispirillia bacterium]
MNTEINDTIGIFKRKIGYFYKYFFWALSRIFVYVYIRRKFNVVLEKPFDKIPKPPFIMVSNHATFFDPWIVGHFSKYPIAIMNNEDAFRSPPIVRWYLKNIGTFPKKKGASDYKAMKTTLKKIQSGYPVLIFPEGQTSWDGETQPVFSGIEKIIKRADVSLVMMNVKGNFLSKPWWADSYRKGKVRVSCKMLHKEKINSMSEKDLIDTFTKFIWNNDILDEDNKKIDFTGKNLACGLERFLWICKNCKSTDTLTTVNNTLSCIKCDSSWIVDSHFNFTKTNNSTASKTNLHEWSLWHKKMTKAHILRTEKYKILAKSSNVIYCSIDKNGKFIPIARGKLFLSKENLSFQATDVESHSFSIATEDITDYVYQRKDVFECRCGSSNTLRFRIIGHSPMKWVYYFRYLNGYEIFEERGFI